MKKGLKIALILVGLFGLTLVTAKFLVSQKQLPKKIKKKDIPKEVQYLPVQYANILTNVVSSGRVLSNSIVRLSAEVSGRILAGDVPFKKSQNFRKGDVLLRIFDADAQQRIRAKKSSFLQAIANTLPDIQLDYPKAYPKWKEFFKTLDIHKPLPELPKTDDEQLKIYLANRNIITSYYTLLSDQINLDKYTIRAPFSGSYTNVVAEVGSFAAMGGVLANIINTSNLEIEAPVEIEKAKYIQIGDQVEILHSSGKTSSGVVVRKSNFVDPSTQSINCFVKFADKEIVAGMYLKVRFRGITIENAMQLKRSVLVDNTKLWLIDSLEQLYLEELQVLKKQSDSFIFRGIKPGARAVVSPLLSPYIGQKVKAKMQRAMPQNSL